MAKASKIQIKTDTGSGIYGEQEVSSVWCENARTNDGENPEITIPKSEVWRYLSLSVDFRKSFAVFLTLEWDPIHQISVFQRCPR